MNESAQSTDADHWIDQAKAAFDGQRYEPALRCLDRAVAADPTRELAHWNRGQVLLLLNRLSEAHTAFEIARSIDPGSVRAALGLAKVALVRHDYAGASALLADVEDRCDDRSVAEWHQLNGVAAVGHRQWDDAIESFKTACAHNPDDPGSLLAQYKTHYRAGHLPEAIEALRRLLSGDEAGQQPLWFLYLTLLAEAGRIETLPHAIEDMMEAVPDDLVLHNLGAGL